MTQQFSNSHPVNKKVSFIVFVKGSIAPVVLYLDEPAKVYENVQKIIKNPASPRVFEIEANGPVKKATFVTGEVTGCALQEEIYIGKQ